MISFPQARPALISLAFLFTVACSGKRPVVAPQIGTASASAVDSIWRLAESNLARRKWAKASIELERVLLLLPFGDRRIAAAHMGLGEAYLGDHSNLLAVREFRLVADLYPTDSLAPEALLRAGDSYASLWRHPDLDPTDGENAIGVYQEVLVRYPQAPAAERAKLAIAELQDRFASKDLRNAEYYIKYKAWDSALIYLRSVVARYPQSKVMPQVLSRMVEIFRELEYAEDITETCGYFKANFPTAPQLRKSCPDRTLSAVRTGS